jgi:hypothetical protein
LGPKQLSLSLLLLPDLSKLTDMLDLLHDGLIGLIDEVCGQGRDLVRQAVNTDASLCLVELGSIWGFP